MKLHMNTDSQAKVDANEFETRTMREIGCPKEIIMRHRPTAFGHIFSGDGYSAGYYVYIWADTMSADAAEAFVEAGSFYDKPTCQRLRETIFSVGNSVSPTSRSETSAAATSTPTRSCATGGSRSRRAAGARGAGRPMVNRLPRRLGVAMLAAASLAWAPPTEAKPNLGKKLLSATLQGDNAGVRELLGQGADPNYADKEGCTPLIVAAGGCSYEMHVGAHGEL